MSIFRQQQLGEYCIMASKNSTDTIANVGSRMRLHWGQEPTDAALDLQKEILDSYGHLSRAWVARVRSEVDLWTNLASRLSALQHPSAALETYTNCVSQQVQMTVDDGRQLLEESQKITQKIVRSWSKGWPTASA